MPKGEKDLRQFIKGKLRTQIDEIWRRAESYHECQKGDNIQGRVHCESVETNLSRLISDEKKKKDMTPMELFILSAAACLHDISKVVPDGTGGWKRDHGKRAMDIILEEYDKLGLDKGQAVAVAFIVGVHNDGRMDELPVKPYVIGSEEIDIIKLAAIFRLVDMLDTNYQRAPEIVSSIKFSNGEIPSKWRGRQAITGWYLDEKNRIILQALPKPEEIEAVLTLKAMMKEDLALISPHLKSYGFPAELDLDMGDVFIKTHLEKKAKLDRPFPGMAFYTQRESAIFKGRDKEIEDLVTLISCWPISLLVGESGAGKTSLIHAGLFPRLEVMKWKYAWTRPFEKPLEYIKKSLWHEFLQGKVDEKSSLLDVMKLAAAKCKPHKLLVVMDQFEDILNCSVPEILEDFCSQLVAVQTGTVIPNLRVLISFREDALVKLNSRLFKKITGSARGLPSVELERLTIDGAREALVAGLEHAGFGIDPRREKGQRPLIDIILDDIRQGEDRIYPPYIQMVAETLCQKVEPGKPVIAGDIYFHQLNSAGHIIARYLLERLKEFGSLEEKAKKVLICLTSSQGKKARKSLSELSLGTGIEVEELKAVMKEMIDIRMARATGEDEFEIIHDYLARLVDEELVLEEDRSVKFLHEQLEPYQQIYAAHKAPIMSPPFLANLYRNRVKIKIDEEKYPLILCTCLLKENGLGWYWLKDIERSQMLEMLKTHISHGKEDIIEEAVNGFVRLSAPEDKENILNMLWDENWYVKQAAGKALRKIATMEDRKTIINILKDKDFFVRQAAVMTLGKIAIPEDMELIINMLRHKGSPFRESAEDAFLKIATPKDQEKIIEMLKHYDEDVRQVAIKALGNIATPEGRGKIIEMLEHYDKHVRQTAGNEFEKIATQEDREKIIEMLKHYDKDVRQVATKAFLKIATPKDHETIIEMLKAEDYHIQNEAGEAFVRIVTSGDMEKIIELLKDEIYYVRQAAAKAFLKIATPEDRERIIEMLKVENYSVRWTAAKALGNIATPGDMEKIIEMVKNEDIDVIKAGVGAFLKIAGPGDHESLLDLLAEQCQDWSVGQLEIFTLLSELDKRLYCPYYEE
jgi:HEAT repeat protein